jgi:hypothetical protein
MRALPWSGLRSVGEDAHGGGLAGAVRPEQTEHGALLRLEVDAVESHDVAVRLGQPNGCDCGF